MNNHFFDAFIQKHGIDTFNYIIDMIKKEADICKFSTSIDDNYFIYIFEIAFFEFCGIETDKIPIFINHFTGKLFSSDISFSKFREVHNNSIEYIKKLFEDVSP